MGAIIAQTSSSRSRLGVTMETSHAKIVHPSKQRRYRSWISRFVLLLGLSLLMYHGYCWGWWGRNSLLMQYIFQCGCPVSSEEVRYPERVDIIVPACRHDVTRLSPSGRLLYVATKVLWNDADYLLDLQTGERTPVSISRNAAQAFGKPVPPKGSVHFLNDALIFHTFYGIDEYVLDWVIGKQYPIQAFIHMQPNAYSYGEVDLDLLFSALLQVEKVFFIDAPFQPVIALSSDFQTHPEHSFTFTVSDFPRDDISLIEKFLQQSNIIYYNVPADFLHEAISPDGRFIAREDGIYLGETDQKIVDGYPGIEPFDAYNGKYFALQGWIYDSTGVIYSKPSKLCLIRFWLPYMDGSECIIEVPQPVVMLKVPEEYLPPAPP